MAIPSDYPVSPDPNRHVTRLIFKTRLMPLLMKYSRYFAELALAASGLALTVPISSAGAAQDSETPGDRQNRNDL